MTKLRVLILNSQWRISVKITRIATLFIHTNKWILDFEKDAGSVLECLKTSLES